MKFPLLSKKKYVYPEKSECPSCKKKGIFEPNSFAVLSGGALVVDRKKKISNMDENLDGFLSFTWHGAHTKLGGKGEFNDVCASIDIASNVFGGQFELYFCSTKCMRDFLNKMVDALEEKMIKISKSRA